MTHTAVVLYPGSYALSLRDSIDPQKGEVMVRHYKIRNKDDGGCYIAARRTFTNIMELVKHYRGKGCVGVGGVTLQR